MQFTIATVFAMATAAMAAPKEIQNLSTRSDGEITCGSSTVVRTDVIRDSISGGQTYLKGLGAVCGAEAHKCARVSCANNAAIWVCNNTDEEINDLECSIMAEYVDHIFDKCQQDGLYAVDAAVGRQDNTDGWNVQAGFNAC